MDTNEGDKASSTENLDQQILSDGQPKMVKRKSTKKMKDSSGADGGGDINDGQDEENWNYGEEDEGEEDWGYGEEVDSSAD